MSKQRVKADGDVIIFRAEHDSLGYVETTHRIWNLPVPIKLEIGETYRVEVNYPDLKVWKLIAEGRDSVALGMSN